MRENRRNRLKTNPGTFYRLKGAEVMEPPVLESRETGVGLRHGLFLLMTGGLRLVSTAFYSVLFLGVVVGVQDIGASALNLGKFEIQKVDIQNNVFLGRSQILKAAAIDTRTNFFSCDLGEIKSRIERMCNVKRATVSRQVPGKIVIRVEERVPLLFPEGAHFLLDEEGKVVQLPSVEKGYDHLTLVSGFSPDVVTGVGFGELERYRKTKTMALFYYNTFKNTDFRLVKIDSKDEWADFILDNGTTVRIPYVQDAAPFQRLSAVLKDLNKKGTRASYIDLQFKDVVVRL